MNDDQGLEKNYGYFGTEKSSEKPLDGEQEARAEAWEGAFGPSESSVPDPETTIVTEEGEAIDADLPGEFNSAARVAGLGFDTASVGLGEHGAEIVVKELENTDTEKPNFVGNAFNNLGMNEETAHKVSEDIKKAREAQFYSDSGESPAEVYRNSINDFKSFMTRLRTEFPNEDIVPYFLRGEKEESLSVFLKNAEEALAEKQAGEKTKAEEGEEQVEALEELKETESLEETADIEALEQKAKTELELGGEVSETTSEEIENLISPLKTDGETIAPLNENEKLEVPEEAA